MISKITNTLVVIDHYTKYTWLFPLKQKSQVKEKIITFKNLVENYCTQELVACIRIMEVNFWPHDSTFS